MARIIDENLEGVGYEESWSEAVSGGNTLDEDASLPGVPPPGAGSQCLKAIAAPGSASAYAGQVKTDQQVSYLRGYLYLEQEGFSEYESMHTLQLRNSLSAVVAGLQIMKIVGSLYARFYFFSNGATQVTGWKFITTQTWIRFEYKYDLANMLWEWKIGGVTQHSGSLAAATRTPAGLRIGITGYAGSGTTIMYTDLIAWDDTDWVGAEYLPYPHLSGLNGGIGNCMQGGIG